MLPGVIELGSVQEYWPLFATPLAMFRTGVELPTCSRLMSTVPAGGVDPLTGARAKRQVMLKVCPSGQTSPPAPGWVTSRYCTGLIEAWVVSPKAPMLMYPPLGVGSLA